MRSGRSNCAAPSLVRTKPESGAAEVLDEGLRTQSEPPGRRTGQRIKDGVNFRWDSVAQFLRMQQAAEALCQGADRGDEGAVVAARVDADRYLTAIAVKKRSTRLPSLGPNIVQPLVSRDGLHKPISMPSTRNRASAGKVELPSGSTAERSNCHVAKAGIVRCSAAILRFTM